MHNSEKATNSDKEVMVAAGQTAENSLEPSNDGDSTTGADGMSPSELDETETTLQK